MSTAWCDTREALDALVGSVEALPSAASVVARYLESEEADGGAERREGLSLDPALAARVLRLANSARYQLPGRVASLDRAVRQLGPRALRLVTLTFRLADGPAATAVNRLYQDYWRRALTLAVTAARVAEASGISEADAAYTAGLLADLGVLVLAEREGERYAPLYQSVAHGPNLLAAERRAFGFDHAAVGARLLQRWGLPESLVAAVADHHADPAGAAPLQRTVRAGDLMADVLWAPNSPSLPAAVNWLHQHFGIDQQGFVALSVACEVEVARRAKLWAPPADTPAPAAADLLSAARRQFEEAALEAAIVLDSLLSAFPA
jgi:HD-like signal output (HDOD) protein